MPGTAYEERDLNSPRQHGPWQVLNSSLVYEDPWLSVRKDDVIRPDGNPGTHSVVNIKAGVSVLAIDEHETAFLTDEFHYAIGRDSLETVSGGIDADESAEQAARRELQEELGIVADDLQHLGLVDPFTSSVVSPTNLFLARGLHFVDPDPEGTEQIRCVKVPFQEAVAMALDGRITHAPSAVLILKAMHVLTD